MAARVAPAASAGRIGLGSAPEVGAAGTLPCGGPVTPSTLFDLASVSKPVLACTLARLVERGVVALETPLASVLPEVTGTSSAELPLELLLSHRAGLDGHRPLFAPVLVSRRPFERRAALRQAASARRPECAGPAPKDGFPPLYSDLGYVLLGACIEALTAQALDHVIWQEVSAPLSLELGSARQLMARRPSFAREVAPTEVVRARGGCVRGAVHDENAWALAGHGCAGHAGVFGSVRDVLGFGQALLSAYAGRSSWLSQRTLSRLVEPRPGGSLRAGFDGKSSQASSAGASAGPLTFGHLGFTGTSLWCDPTAEIATVLLTNRVHPTREGPSASAIRAARPVLHELLFQAPSPVLPGAPDP